MSRSRPGGFTLIEVMIAMAVLAIGMIATGPLVHYAIGRGMEARRVTAGQHLATEILERLRTEVRYDAEPLGGTLGSYPFTLATAWNADRLPYSTQDTVAGAVGPLADCNPAGAADFRTYRVGPFPMRFESYDFFVCYHLGTAPAALGAPGSSVLADLKILWRSPGGWSARWVSGVLLDGR